MVRLALCSALSDRAADERVVLVDPGLRTTPKTKDAVAALAALGLTGRVLVVLGRRRRVAERSFANLPDVQTALVGELSAYDILRNDWVVFTDETLPGAEIVEVIEMVDAVDTETGEEVDRRSSTPSGRHRDRGDAVVIEEEIDG